MPAVDIGSIGFGSFFESFRSFFGFELGLGGSMLSDEGSVLGFRIDLSLLEPDSFDGFFSFLSGFGFPFSGPRFSSDGLAALSVCIFNSVN